MNKVKQQEFILLISLYILRKNGYTKPPKRQVLNFIELRGLITQFEEDEALRCTGDSIRENDLAWKRKNLFDRGLIRSPEIGIWELSPAGVALVEQLPACKEWVYDQEKCAQCLAQWEYLTWETIAWMRRIIEGDFDLRQEPTTATTT